MQNLHLKDFTSKGNADRHARYTGAPPPSGAAVALFLNISMKSLYMTLFQEGLNGPDPACAADYKKIYSYLTAKVPKVAEMTVGQFLRYVTNTHMKLDDASTDADKRTMAVGKRLAELFFIDTFYPLLKRTGARYETTLLKLRYPEKDKSRKEQ